MMLKVTSNGFTRIVPPSEIASIVSVVEYQKIKNLRIGETYSREPFAGMSGTYEFKAERVA